MLKIAAFCLGFCFLVVASRFLVASPFFCGASCRRLFHGYYSLARGVIHCTSMSACISSVFPGIALQPLIKENGTDIASVPFILTVAYLIVLSAAQL